MFRRIAFLCLSFCLLLPCSATLTASTYFESPDAGELLSTAQAVPGGVTVIHGAISPLGDIDLYKITFGQAANVNVMISVPYYRFATDATIFDSAGHPLLASYSSVFQLHVNPATYYFGLADWDVVATDSAGKWIADDFTGLLDGTGVLGGWLATSIPLRGGTYDISLSVATVPEPSAILILLCGVGGLLSLRRRN